jgi:S1-C subfamily serine protease
VVPVKLGVAPESRPRDPIEIKNRSPLAGVTVMNLSPAVAEELSVEAVSSGVVVSAVEDNSNAQQVGFQKGDVIVSINNDRPATSKDVERITRERSLRWVLQISRGGQIFTQQLFGR